MLIIVTVLVAIFSDTYVKFTETRQGQYLSGLIGHMPQYKTAPYYGSLVALSPPFDIIRYPLAPLYLVIKNKRSLELFNEV